VEYRLRDPDVGTGVTDYRPLAGAVPDLGTVRDLSTGYAHSCAIAGAADVVRCWGENFSEQLGASDTDIANTEIVETSIPGVRAVATGAAHTCVMLAGGTVQCWGSNTAGQLARDPQTTPGSATPLPMVGLENVVELTASLTSTCARRSDGKVACWGGNFGEAPVFASRQEAPLDDATRIAGGVASTCALREGGTVVCWGLNSKGQLGDPNRALDAPVGDHVDAMGLTSIVDLAVGAGHACAVDGSGQVYCWGDDSTGALHVAAEADADGIVRTPSRVPALTDVIDVAVGNAYSCARRRSGQVVCWGDNQLGQLGDGTAVARDEIRNVVGLP
jgi:alpha-tubulin suppressor-like RCC1 family protein